MIPGSHQSYGVKKGKNYARETLFGSREILIFDQWIFSGKMSTRKLEEFLLVEGGPAAALKPNAACDVVKI